VKSFNKNGYVNDPSYSIYQLKLNDNLSFEFKLSHQYGSRNHKSFYEYQKTFDRMHLKRLQNSDFNSTNKEYYIIVAYDEPPYLFVEELSSDDETICSIESMICYEIDSTDRLPRDFFDLLSKNESKILIGGSYGKFKKRCCYGISISILNIINTKLKEIGQKELKFYLYVLKHSISKLMNKTNKLLNLADEVVFDLFTFQADFTIAPLSFNRRQEEFIDFTSEFYHDDFVVIGKRDFGNASLLAFLAPFEWSIWIGIFLTLTFAALVQTIYEWISPYGLTPRGRNRVQIWSLASALTLNWSVLFSHTFKTKSPKCWANRFDC
jgi:ionotropic glutamate receptor NMDA 3A